ncbi:MAG: hypothetical protein ACLFQA_05415 [Bacteroidales bacterium]
MKLEKVLFKMSFTETLILSLFFFGIFNGFILLFMVLTGRTGFLLYDNAWIIQVFFPFMYSIIQTSINRNGILKISGYNDLLSLVKKIENLVFKKGYIPTEPKKQILQLQNRIRSTLHLSGRQNETGFLIFFSEKI